jgi:uncharacterized protein (TIGR03437 family)
MKIGAMKIKLLNLLRSDPDARWVLARIRFRGALETVKSKVGEVDAPVAFAGAQGSFVGLDQVNLLLPRALAGRGEVNVPLTVDGKSANPVKVSVK